MSEDDRWSRIRGFVRKWYRAPLGPKDGLSAAELKRAKVALPAALREFHALLGARLKSFQDCPVPPKSLRLEDGMLAVYRENQSTVTWAIREDALDQPDPPVFVEDHWGEHDDPWLPQHDTLSEFLTAIVLSEALIGAWSGKGRGSLGPLADDVRGGTLWGAESALAKAYHPLPLQAWRWPVYPTRFYGDADTLVRMGPAGENVVEVAARTPAAWEAVQEVVARGKGTWD